MSQPTQTGVINQTFALMSGISLRAGGVLAGGMLAGGVLAGGVLAGCALSPGQPWGLLDAQLSVGITPEQGRLDAQGRLLTNESYAYTLEGLTLVTSALTVSMGEDAAGTLSFDPAAPPEGYSNCHSGHCHTADGGIATYEEIEASLTGGEPQGTERALSASAELRFEAATEGSANLSVTVLGCSSAQGATLEEASCTLEPGYLTSVQLTVTSFELRGRLFDTAEPARLPLEGVPFVLSSETALALSGTPAESDRAEVGKDQKLWLKVAARLPWTAAALDNIDWGSVVADSEGIVRSDGAPELETVRENLLTHALLQLTITRE